MLLKSETPERVKKTAQNGSIFVVFLAIFISFFSTANSVMASEVTGDLSTGLVGPKVLNTVNSTVIQEDVTSGLISIGSFSPISTPNFTFNVDYILNAGKASVSIPAYTIVTKTGGGNLNLLDFSISDNTIEIKNELGDVLGSIKIGIPDISLTFSQPITVTIPVGTDYNSQILTTYYRNEGSTGWNTETTCLITDGNCTFQTSHATTFATRKNSASSSTSSSTSSNSSSNNSAPSCGDAKPASIPDLFQINVNGTIAKLFFTPINNTSQFYVSFSENTNAEKHGELVTLLREGVQDHTIYSLKPNTSYYLKVRGQNGCMPGDWSNVMKITTRSKGITKTTVFYKKTNIITKIISKVTSIFTPKKVTKTPTPEPIPTIITQTESNTTIVIPPVIIKKRCFLWWCF